MTDEEAQMLFDDGMLYYKHSLFNGAIEIWEKIYKENNIYYEARYYIGLAYAYLDPCNYQISINIWRKIPKEATIYSEAQWNIGVAYIQLDDVGKAVESFANTENDIFDMLQVLHNPPKREIAKKVIFKILDKKTHNSFNNIVIGKTDEERNSYKEIFIQSLEIISLLYVHVHKKIDGNIIILEPNVAHYTRKWVAEQILFTKSKLRLSNAIGSNDPKEGKTLLDFLEIDSQTQLRTPYQAFISCFTFNTESLNQFRLYGKEDKKEATGVSILLKHTLFNDRAKIVFSHEENKLSLYRCIYIDPKTKKIISIGHKEEYSFYRDWIIGNNKDYKEKIINNYKESINKTLGEIRCNMDELNKLITNNPKLDSAIVAELLLPLRYLTKHVAFKEEQECRIFDIENLKTSKKIFPRNPTSFSEMYLEYNEDLTQHIEKVIFAPMTPELEQFEAFSKYKGYNFPCERCDHPFSTKTT